MNKNLLRVAHLNISREFLNLGTQAPVCVLHMQTGPLVKWAP